MSEFRRLAPGARDQVSGIRSRSWGPLVGSWYQVHLALVIFFAVCPLLEGALETPSMLTACSVTSFAGPQQQSDIPSEFEDSASTISLRADSQQKVKDTFTLRGHVVVTYREMKLTADEVTYDDSTGQVVALGNVAFADPKVHFQADSASYNVQTGAGSFENGQGYVRAATRPRHRVLSTESPFFVRARRLERVDEDNFRIESGRVSSCEDEKKGWSLATRRARLEVGNKVVSQGDVFRFLRVPIFYAPALVSSVRHDPRQTGFLLPQIGTSSQKGTVIGDAFFWAINPSADMLLGLENYSSRGLARTGRFRTRPSETSQLVLEYFAINDRGIGPQRRSEASGQSWRAQGQVDDLAWGFRGVVDVDYINSLAFRTTWSPTFNEAVASDAHQTGFLTKNFGAYSVNFYTSRYQSFLSAAPENEQSIIIRQLPSFSVSGMDNQVGRSPFYLALDASAGGVGRSEPGFETDTVTQRLDLHPQLTLRAHPLWGFHFTPTLGLRGTHYGTSGERSQNSVNRLLAELGADLRPPSFEKTWARRFWGYRVKHVIEPDVQYHLVRSANPENILDVVRFDEMDIFTETSEVEYSLTNSILTRKDVPDGQADRPQARELISWRLSEKYYFEPAFSGAVTPGSQVPIAPTISLTGFSFPEGRRLSPLNSVLKFAPSSNYDTEFRTDFDPNGGGLLNAGISSHVHQGPLSLALTDFFVDHTVLLPSPLARGLLLTGLPSLNLLSAAVSYGELSRKGLTGTFRIDYNIEQAKAQDVVGQVSYNFGCFGVNFGFQRFSLGLLRRENSFRVSFSLANVGTFGNLKPSERLDQIR